MSICPERSRIAGKALETKAAGVARLRAPVHRLLIVYLFIWLEVSMAIMFPQSEQIIEEKYEAAWIRVCDLTLYVIMLPSLDLVVQHQALLNTKDSF